MIVPTSKVKGNYWCGIVKQNHFMDQKEPYYLEDKKVDKETDKEKDEDYPEADAKRGGLPKEKRISSLYEGEELPIQNVKKDNYLM